MKLIIEAFETEGTTAFCAKREIRFAGAHVSMKELALVADQAIQEARAKKFKHLQESSDATR
jgi:hypothetical protein